jgi:hypothetical protein
MPAVHFIKARSEEGITFLPNAQSRKIRQLEVGGYLGLLTEINFLWKNCNKGVN